ncbi:response regulator [Candidatus Synechococcus calcipolaris G9]|uniref:Response regulator n=1 Tax=Candidatus Synechococcus calcipolaris G9 TaxID=1497997 RepID=A0ABT6EV96_9SYNE|nr:response regulator [Candidatus Synechococcus calcipolaris]MDG2989742.1 response regulator [Candidatus Synechococcus calcipolaris G9]
MQKKIVVIDDSKVIRMRVRDMIPEGDYEIVEAKDGREGLDRITESTPTLIMLDFILPKVSGWEIVQELEKRQLLGRVPLVIMSGRREEVTEKLREPFELFEFIEKPFEKADLEEAIKRAFSKARLAPLPAPEPTPQPAAGAVDHSELLALKTVVSQLQDQINAAPAASGGVDPAAFAQLKATVEQLQAQGSGGSGADRAKIAALEAQNKQLHTELDALKRTVIQVVNLIKKMQASGSHH